MKSLQTMPESIQDLLLRPCIFGLKDAAAVTFLPGTRVDTRRILGFRSAEEDPGTTYCIAPVLDLVAAELSEVRYWAVGTDCCEPAWGFSCGASLSTTARSGVVIRDLQGSTRAALQYKLYKEAAEQAAAMYQLGTPGESIFVTWSEDAEGEVGFGFDLALLYCCILSAIHLMLSVVGAAFMHSGVRPKAKPLQIPPLMARYQSLKA